MSTRSRETDKKWKFIFDEAYTIKHFKAKQFSEKFNISSSMFQALEVLGYVKKLGWGEGYEWIGKRIDQDGLNKLRRMMNDYQYEHRTRIRTNKFMATKTTHTLKDTDNEAIQKPIKLKTEEENNYRIASNDSMSGILKMKHLGEDSDFLSIEKAISILKSHNYVILKPEYSIA